jgi:hypothetical protein
MTDAFLRLAASSGFALPATLLALYRDGRTDYGTDWPSVWRQRMLEDPPALISVYDFEWKRADEIAETIDAWLQPKHQHGRRFLPFGQSGAGDQFCLTTLDDGRIGVASIWHDRDRSSIAYPDFDSFICAKFIATMADLGHLIDDDFTAEEAQRCLLADIDRTARYLPDALRTQLHALSGGPLLERPYRYGPKRTEPTMSLIAQADEEDASQRFHLQHPPSFAIVARWDIA